ncbi:hypothetical protein AB7M17_004146 [Bradyrhizobium sp. USDA 377]
MTNHACLHHNAACRAEQSGAAKGQPAAAKRRAPIGCSTPASCGLPRGVSCFLRGPQHLVDEALRLRRAGTADASRPNTQIAVAHAHGKACQRSKSHMVPKTPLIPLVKMQSAARAPTDRQPEPKPCQWLAVRPASPFYLAFLIGHAKSIHVYAFLRLSALQTSRTPCNNNAHTSPKPRPRFAFSRRGPCVPSRSALWPSHALHQVRKQGCPSSLALSSRRTEAGKK